MKINNKNLTKMASNLTSFFSRHKKIAFLSLILLAFCYVVFVFYSYAWNVSTRRQLIYPKTSINNELFDKAMNNLKEREGNFKQEEFKTYLDPFY